MSLGRPQRIEPGAGQESVWDYPRPPVAVRCDVRVRVRHRGILIAESTSTLRVLETSQPPAYYLPRADVRTDLLVASPRQTVCEWKGVASYWSIAIEETVAADAAWSYESPVPEFASIRGHVAFYARAVDECWVGDERVQPNPGDFYGGWITSDIVGPFKGQPGTMHW